MARTDDVTRASIQALNGLLLPAIIDVVMLIFTAIWVIFICSGGTVVWDPTTILSVKHAGHILMILAIFILYAFDVAIYVPIWFALLALLLLAMDLYILVARSYMIFNAPLTLGCDFFLLISDVIFLFLTIGYLGFIGRSISWYGLFGDSSDSSDPLLASQSKRTTIYPTKAEFVSATATAAVAATTKVELPLDVESQAHPRRKDASTGGFSF